MKIYLFISILFLTFSCSKNFSKIAIQPVVPPKTAKISGNHLIYISDTKFNHNKEIISDDCESWALNLDFNEPLRKSIKDLVDLMFENYKISNEKLSKDEIEKYGYVTQVSFSNFNGISNFKTERNTGKYEILLNINIKVENSVKKIDTEISSSMRWEKNIFLNCNLHEGSVKSSQKALENLIKNSYESAYKSINQIIR